MFTGLGRLVGWEELARNMDEKENIINKIRRGKQIWIDIVDYANLTM